MTLCKPFPWTRPLPQGRPVSLAKNVRPSQLPVSKLLPPRWLVSYASPPCFISAIPACRPPEEGTLGAGRSERHKAACTRTITYQHSVPCTFSSSSLAWPMHGDGARCSGLEQLRLARIM